MVSEYKFSFYSLSKFKFRDQLYSCNIGYSDGTLQLIQDHKRDEMEKREYYFNDVNDGFQEFNKRSVNSYDQDLSSDIIPSSVRTICYSANPERLIFNALPSTIKTLIINDHFSNSILVITSNDIPEFIENLQLDPRGANIYNLPIGLRALSYKGRFNSYLSELPSKNLQYLEFGRNYSKSLNHLLPSLKALKSLTLGSSYQQVIKAGHLPNSLEFLSICCTFEEDSLPRNLKVLEIGSQVSVGSKLPDSLKCLIFTQGTNEIFKVDDLPHSLEYLDFGRGKAFDEGFSFLPKGLTELIIGDSFNMDFCEMDYENLPSSLSSITFGKSFNQDLNIQYIPKSIKSIIFKNDYKMYKVENLKRYGIKVYKQSIDNNNNYNSNNNNNNINLLNKFIKNPIIFNNYSL